MKYTELNELFLIIDTQEYYELVGHTEHYCLLNLRTKEKVRWNQTFTETHLQIWEPVP